MISDLREFFRYDSLSGSTQERKIVQVEAKERFPELFHAALQVFVWEMIQLKQQFVDNPLHQGHPKMFPAQEEKLHAAIFRLAKFAGDKAAQPLDEYAKFFAEADLKLGRKTSDLITALQKADNWRTHHSWLSRLLLESRKE